MSLTRKYYDELDRLQFEEKHVYGNEPMRTIQ